MTKKVIPPTNFVGLHAHSTFSVGDAIGRPQDHIDYALKNGMDALALTDHGNMNGFSHQYLHYENLKKKGVTFKALPGVEAYFVPSLVEWKTLYDADQEKKRQEKIKKKRAQHAKKIKDLVGDPLASTKEELVEMQVEREADEGFVGDTGVEDEKESKRARWSNPIRRRNHLVLLPKNHEGLKALFACVSHSFIDGFYFKPRMDFDLLKKYANGNIIALTACVAGTPSQIIFDNQESFDFDAAQPNDYNADKIYHELGELIGRFQETLGPENFYLEMQFNKLGAQHLVNKYLIEASKRFDAPLVVTCDSHYSDPSHWREREIYRAMSGMQKGGEKLPESVDDLKCELYPKTAEEVWQTYKETTAQYDFYDDQVVRDAIEQSYSIAHDQISDVVFDKKVKLPSLAKMIDKDKLPKEEKYDEDEVAFEHLKLAAIQGAKWRGVADKDNYIERLRTELSVVKKLKFSKYFLTYAKIMQIAEQYMLIGNARGSAGGSLLAYVLNITQMDPLKYGLLFERFLTPNKKGFPDIDSDFGDRDKAYKLLLEHFGHENVIPVSNFNQLQLKSLIKDLCRFHGVPFDEINAKTKKIEIEAKNEAKKQKGFDAAMWDLTFDEAYDKSPTFRALLDEHEGLENSLKVLFKQMRNISRHAGGVIITENTRESMPIVQSGGVLQTPWPEGLNFRHLETFGFLKFDILGLLTLRMFESCIRRILKKHHGIKYPTFEQVKTFFYENLHPDNNDMDDLKVYENVYWNGNYTGIFQFVQEPAQKFISKMKPRSIVDIAAATSIFRPGPLGVDADKFYLQNRRNPENIVYQHPLLEEALADTYGIVVFQEQLQLIYHKLAGVDLNDTDNIRKAFTKKEKANKEESEKLRLELREDFIVRCEETNGIDPVVSGEIFDGMDKFVAYSFNKSHATAYAITSYQCAWFLTYYPDEWICTNIDMSISDKGKVSGKEDPKNVALSEAKKLGYRVGRADINESSLQFECENNTLIPSFSSYKGVGTTAFSEIEKFKPYKTVEDLLWNANDTWRHSKFNKKALSTLVKLEALNSMGIVGEDCQFKNYKQLHHVVVDNADKLKRAISRKKQTHKEVLAELIEEAQELDDWTSAEKIQFVKELAGSVDIDMIITPELTEYFDMYNIRSVDHWRSEEEIYWAIVQSSRVATTKNGKKYCKSVVYGESNKTQYCNLWNFREGKDKPLPECMVILGKFKKNDFGLSSFYGRIEVLEEKD